MDIRLHCNVLLTGLIGSLNDVGKMRAPKARRLEIFLYFFPPSVCLHNLLKLLSRLDIRDLTRFASRSLPLAHILPSKQ
jgi:hypothetical protein